MSVFRIIYCIQSKLSVRLCCFTLCMSLSLKWFSIYQSLCLLLVTQQKNMWSQTRPVAEDCPSPPSNREQSLQPSLAGSRPGNPRCGRWIHWTESVLVSTKTKGSFHQSDSVAVRHFLMQFHLSQFQSLSAKTNVMTVIRLNGCLYALVTVPHIGLHKQECNTLLVK